MGIPLTALSRISPSTMTRQETNLKVASKVFKAYGKGNCRVPTVYLQWVVLAMSLLPEAKRINE